jgi:hypothetical protein
MIEVIANMGIDASMSMSATSIMFVTVELREF